MKGYGEFTVVKPLTETVTASGIVIQGDLNGNVVKGLVISPGFDTEVLQADYTIYYFKNTAAPLPGCDYFAVENKNIIAYEPKN